MTNASDFSPQTTFSVAFTETINTELSDHFASQSEEDLAFGLWMPSQGSNRFTAVIREIILPRDGDRNVHGNASFNSQYVHKILNRASNRSGIVFIHSHLGPGWQNMSRDDIIAERDILSGPVSGMTELPLLGMTRGTDGAWSARFWLRSGVKKYERRWADSVRVVGKRLRVTYLPDILDSSQHGENQIATRSVWGKYNQSLIANTHVGIVGLGSVGSLVAEALSRIGVSKITLIDPQQIETRNLDRTLGAIATDVVNKIPKVIISERLITASHTSENLQTIPVIDDVTSQEGIKRSLDCDVIFSCVDRPWPRHHLNALSYSHLIPVIDGGIIAKTKDDHPVNVDWRIHTVGPEKKCLVCLGALKEGEIALDKSGMLNDQNYIQNMDENMKHLISRENVFAFSMSLAAHEVIQFAGLVTGLTRIGGIGPQFYHAFPGCMEVSELERCRHGCQYDELTSSASDLAPNTTDPPSVIP